MNGKVKILFFCMIFVAGRAFSQKNTSFRYQCDALFYYKMAGFRPNKTNSFATKVAADKKTASTFGTAMAKQQYLLIPENFYSSNFGFFCKKELQLEKFTRLPLKFRLGSMEQCDRLEGKNISITQ